MAGSTLRQLVLQDKTGKDFSVTPGSYIKKSRKTGRAHWTLTVDKTTTVFTYTNRRGECRVATMTEVTKLIDRGYTTRL